MRAAWRWEGNGTRHPAPWSRGQALPGPARPCPPALTGLPTTRLCLGFQNSRLEMTGCRAAHAQSHRTDGARARFAGGPTTRPARTARLNKPRKSSRRHADLRCFSLVRGETRPGNSNPSRRGGRRPQCPVRGRVHYAGHIVRRPARRPWAPRRGEARRVFFENYYYPDTSPLTPLPRKVHQAENGDINSLPLLALFQVGATSIAAQSGSDSYRYGCASPAR